MCEHCGCTPDTEESRHRRMHEQGIPHKHEHRLTVERDILSLNNSRAEENRSYFARRGICAVNLVSFPVLGRRHCWNRPCFRFRERYPSL